MALGSFQSQPGIFDRPQVPLSRFRGTKTTPYLGRRIVSRDLKRGLYILAALDGDSAVVSHDFLFWMLVHS